MTHREPHDESLVEEREPQAKGNVALAHDRNMRKDPTEAERKLWNSLRAKQLGMKFRRQHPMDQYIAFSQTRNSHRPQPSRKGGAEGTEDATLAGNDHG